MSLACASVSSFALYITGHAEHDNGFVVSAKNPALHRHRAVSTEAAEFVGHAHMMLVMHNNKHHTWQIQFCD